MFVKAARRMTVKWKFTNYMALATDRQVVVCFFPRFRLQLAALVRAQCVWPTWAETVRRWRSAAETDTRKKHERDRTRSHKFIFLLLCYVSLPFHTNFNFINYHLRRANGHGKCMNACVFRASVRVRRTVSVSAIIYSFFFSHILLPAGKSETICRRRNAT